MFASYEHDEYFSLAKWKPDAVQNLWEGGNEGRLRDEKITKYPLRQKQVLLSNR